MRKLFCLLLVFAMVIPAFAEIKISGTPPTYDGPANPDFDSAIQKAFDNAIDRLNDDLKVFKSPDKFLQAMGDSSVFASHGATTRNYGGYELFTATIGPMFGLQFPKDISSALNDIDGLSNSLKDEGDIKFGISPNMINLYVGLNMSVFEDFPETIGVLEKDSLYIGLRVGYFGLPEIPIGGDDLKLKNFSHLTLGLTLNYQIMHPIELAEYVLWRGINIGTGFLYNRGTLGLSFSTENFEEKISKVEDKDNALIVFKDMEASINLTSNTFTIPLEVFTSIKLLIFNIPLGVGVDFAFGRTSLGAGVSADIDLKGPLPAFLYPYREGKGNITAEGEVGNAPSIFNFKLMSGFGINAGPVVFDIPITWYPATGYSVGISMGAVF